MAVARIDGHFVECNDEFVELTGYTRAELLSTNIFALTHPEDLPKMFACVRGMLARKYTLCKAVKKWIQKTGELFSCSCMVSVVTNPTTGAPKYFVCFGPSTMKKHLVMDDDSTPPPPPPLGPSRSPQSQIAPFLDMSSSRQVSPYGSSSSTSTSSSSSLLPISANVQFAAPRAVPKLIAHPFPQPVIQGISSIKLDSSSTSSVAPRIPHTPSYPLFSPPIAQVPNDPQVLRHPQHVSNVFPDLPPENIDR